MCRKTDCFSAPSENLAAKIITDSNSGIVVDSSDIQGFSAAVCGLITDKIRSDTMAINARKYAEANFNIEKITDDFENIFRDIT